MHDLNQVSIWLLCTKSIVLDAWTILSFLWFKKTKMKTNRSTQAPSVKELIQQFSVSLKTKYDYFHGTSLMRRFGKCHVSINRKTVWYCMYIFKYISMNLYELCTLPTSTSPKPGWLTASQRSWPGWILKWDAVPRKLTMLTIPSLSQDSENFDRFLSFGDGPTLADPLVQVEWSWSTCSWERSLGTWWWWWRGGG